MDDSQEQNIIKKATYLHASLESHIAELVQLVHSNTISPRDQYEQSKLIFSKIIVTINEFEPQPKLLDSRLSAYIGTLTDLYLFLHANHANVKLHETQSAPSNDSIASIFAPKIGEVIYNFSKIRGFKHITNYFSSDVYLIPQLIQLTLALEDDNELFLCLIWLSNLVLVPFKLDHIDVDLTSQLIEIGIQNLAKHSNASKNQLISSILISRILARSDVYKETDHLRNYFNLTVEPEWKSLDRLNGSVKLGHLITINKILKKCPIDVVQEFVSTIYSLISTDLINLRFQQESNMKHLNNLNILYMIKILSKLSMICVKQDNYTRSGEIISNLLNDIMNVMTTFDTSLRYAMAKSLAHMTTLLSVKAINYQEQLVVYLMKQLNIKDLTINQNFDGMDTDSPQIFFDSSLRIVSDEISIPKFHTVLLYLGFTALEKSFPKHLIPSVLSIIHRTLFLEQRRFSTVLGSQVRDSSCFVLWALCRLLTQKDYLNITNADKLMMENIFLDMLILVISDEELLLRRCGVAVIQEFVGRFGEILFGKYIESKDRLGEFTIKLVELFNSSQISSISSSYTLIHELVVLGFDKDLFVSKLLQRVLDEDAKFEIRKLSSLHLKLLMRTKQDNWMGFRVSENPLRYDIDYILFSIKGNLYATSDFLSDEAISDLAPIDGETVKSYLNSLIDQTADFKFDYHTDTHEKAESFLKWIIFKISYGHSIDNDWPVLLNIMRLTSTHELISGFESVFSRLSTMNVPIPSSRVNDFQYYLKNNNVTLSRVIFVYQKFDPQELTKFIDLLVSKEVDCAVRSNMIGCFSAYNLEITERTAEILIELLDDYTITKQGDVGSKIRFSIIKLISANIGAFVGHDLTYRIRLKLVRLAGELIDKIRCEAMKLILKLEGTKSEGIDKLSIFQYFRELFSYYEQSILNLYEQNSQNKDFSLQFWKGISFTLGALTANSQILNESFNELLQFLGRCNNEYQSIIFQNLTTLLKMPGGDISAREQKSYIVVLHVIVKLLESNFRFPVKFNFEALYIRCYNLQINTSNLVRIGLTLNILQHLACLSEHDKEIRNKCRKRVITIAFTHKLNKVRQMAGEVLFEIINEANSSDQKTTELLDDINWEDSPSTLKSFKERIEKLFVSI